MKHYRLATGASLLALGSVSLACQTTSQQTPGYAPPSHASPNPGPAPGGPPAANSIEAYWAPQALKNIGSAQLFLPGSARQQQVNFATVNGQAILEGDVMLGPATTLPLRYGIPWQSSMETKSAVAVASRTYLWPGAEIPYAIDGSAQGKTAMINWAIRVFEGTPIRIRPRTASDRDYVVFRDLGTGCWSYLGRQGGPQDIDVNTCAGGNIAHELMHAAGFYHEQSRGDRDQFVSIMWDEIAPEMRSNFDKRDARGQDIGAYDYDSIMHYPSHAGSRAGNPTIVPRVPNARIGQREGLSTLDRAAIEVLYPSAGRPAVAAAPVPAPAPAAAAPAPVPSFPLPGVALPPSGPTAAQPPAAPQAPNPTPVPASATGSTSFTGTYSSTRGNVDCNQGGLFVQCQYPGGSLFCAANGPELSCTWNGGGQGRATFQRQTNGVLAGAWGDGFSPNSRGKWDLVPVARSASAPAAPTPVPNSPTPTATQPPAPATAASASLSGTFTSTRGPMSCTESGSSLGCNFQEADGVNGRLDCARSQNGLELSCAWITFFPRPATGRAAFTRASPGDRRLTGTWGPFLAATGGGKWDAVGQ